MKNLNFFLGRQKSTRWKRLAGEAEVQREDGEKQRWRRGRKRHPGSARKPPQVTLATLLGASWALQLFNDVEFLREASLSRSPYTGPESSGAESSESHEKAEAGPLHGGSRQHLGNQSPQTLRDTTHEQLGSGRDTVAVPQSPHL